MNLDLSSAAVKHKVMAFARAIEYFTNLANDVAKSLVSETNDLNDLLNYQRQIKESFLDLADKGSEVLDGRDDDSYDTRRGFHEALKVILLDDPAPNLEISNYDRFEKEMNFLRTQRVYWWDKANDNTTSFLMKPRLALTEVTIAAANVAAFLLRRISFDKQVLKSRTHPPQPDLDTVSSGTGVG